MHLIFTVKVLVLLFVNTFAFDSIRNELSLETAEHLRYSRQTGLTCICVPPGTCTNGTGGGGGSSDGSGIIDIRIVTNPNQPPGPGPTTCSYGLVICCQPGPYRCGVRYPPPANSPTPSNGRSPYGAYPWQAAILTTGDIYLGSGALIDNRHILTVAHKVNNVPASSIKVRLGEWDATSTSEPIPAQDFTIQRIFINSGYSASNLFNDIAILRLSNAVDLGRVPTIGTACLSPTNFAGATCWISGWGRDDFGPNGRFQAIQKNVDVYVRNADDCQNRLRATRLGPSFNFNSASFLCAGGDIGKDSCTGDGGAPLVCLANGRWSVIGLVAWGIGCGTSNVPGVYVNVANYIPWIQSTVTTP